MAPNFEFVPLIEKSRMVSVVLAIVMLTLISATAYRTYNNYSVPKPEFDWSNRGHCDFHNGAYYPAMAFRDGVNPYANAMKDSYMVAAPTPMSSCRMLNATSVTSGAN